MTKFTQGFDYLYTYGKHRAEWLPEVSIYFQIVDKGSLLSPLKE